jgi:CheY-like chemotaxis protein
LNEPAAGDQLVSGSRNRIRVAIVDDEPAICRSLLRLLTVAGLDARAHSSGRDFLDVWSGWPPDCVVLDVQMPGLNGFDVFARLRQDGGRMPVIMITANDDPNIRSRATAAAVDAFLLKPIDGESLLRDITELAAQWRSTAMHERVSTPPT